MTIILLGDERKKEQALKQLRDQVNVWAVIEAGTNSLKREMVLVKVGTFPPDHELSADSRAQKGEEQPMVVDYGSIMESHAHREAVTALAKLFEAEVVDVGTNQIILELVSWSRRVDAFLRAVQPFGVIEVARSGPIAMRRSEVIGGWADSARTPTQVADLAALPPS